MISAPLGERVACAAQLALAAALLLASACATKPTENPAPVTLPCNVIGSSCLLPWPSSVFASESPSSLTGLSIGFPADGDFAGLHEVMEGEVLDGFSPIGAITTWLPEGASSANLPETVEESTSAESPIQLVNADATSPSYGQRHPFFAEVVDTEESEGQLLVLTPLAAMTAGSRYAVVITQELRSPSGHLLQASSTQRALLGLEDLPSSNSDLGALRSYYEDLQYLVSEPLGIPLEAVVQLWDFPIRSDEALTVDMRSMSAWTEAWLLDHPPQPSWAEVTQPVEGFTRYNLEFEVPLWRNHRFDPLPRAEDGSPEPVGTTMLGGYLLVPTSATPEHPARPVLFGHGLGAHADLMITSLLSMNWAAGPFAVLAFDWDLHGSRGDGVDDIVALTGDLNWAGFVGAVLQSSMDARVATEMLLSLGELPENGGQVVSGESIFYVGQSLGSIVGTLALSANDVLEAAVLNVGGGGISNILRHGEVVDLLGMRDAINARVSAAPPTDFPSDLGYDVALVVGQVGLDYADPISFASHVRADRFPGADQGQPAVLLQESIGDGIIPNITTEALARTLGLPLIQPAQSALSDFETVNAPTCGASKDGLAQFYFSDIRFQAHLALEQDMVQDQAMLWLQSFADEDPSNDGNIAFPSVSNDGTCP